MSGTNGARTSAVRTEQERGTAGDIPSPRSAADAYRVSDDQVHQARIVVARNSQGPEDLKLLLDMLGLVSSNPDLPPPVSR